MDHLRQAVRTVHIRKNGTMTDEHLETLMQLKRKGCTAHHADEMTGPGFRKEEMWEAITTLEAQLAERDAEVGRLIEQKDGAYSERNKLLTALSKLLTAWLERHPEEDIEWEDDWRWIVFINHPSGAMSWHIHDSELGWFDHLRRQNGNSWDGHTTEEKYERLAALTPDEPAKGAP